MKDRWPEVLIVSSCTVLSVLVVPVAVVAFILFALSIWFPEQGPTNKTCREGRPRRNRRKRCLQSGLPQLQSPPIRGKIPDAVRYLSVLLPPSSSRYDAHSTLCVVGQYQFTCAFKPEAVEDTLHLSPSLKPSFFPL